jgi:hypothetical protein
MSRYKVKFIHLSGKIRWTEVTASSKINAAVILMDTIAEKVLAVEPIREDKE